MAFRDWRSRRVIGLGLLWILVIGGWTIARTVLRSLPYLRAHPGEEAYFIISRPPGGIWSVLGPPSLLLVVWWALRRSRPAR